MLVYSPGANALSCSIAPWAQKEPGKCQALGPADCPIIANYAVPS